MPGAIQTDVARHSSAARHLSAKPSRPSILAWVAGVVVTAIGIGLRFYEPSALWLDETISVNISRLPLFQIPGGLRQDGAPPLYYFLLHFWMLAFGNSDVAVRSMSGVISVVTLPLLWLAGRRLGGRRLGWIVYFLAVTSPFLIEYATTTRMYSLMMLMSTLGFLALASALRSPKPLRLVLLGLVTAGTLYTHYWGLYLVAVTGLWLLYHLWRHHRGLPTRQNPAAVWRCLVAMAVGSLLFIPWAPIFVFQSLHTGTPWTSPAGPADLLNVFTDFAGGNNGPWAELLSFCYFGLLAVGVFVRPALISGARSPAHADGGRDGEAGLATDDGDGAGSGDETGSGEGTGDGDGTDDDGTAGNDDGTAGNGAVGHG
ncbi:MAG TPA: glycosyltransferase family 39 protein [Acidimicrobiales bacterium]|nr:glycosyltransferase family 39 protein [Acidimicrobiales bacterium]